MKKIVILLLLCPLISFNVPNGIDVFLGDSVTFGNELGALQYTARWTTKYTTAVNTEENNLALSGEAITPDLNPGRPFLDIHTLPDYNIAVKHLFISFWINDYLYGGTPEKFASATATVINVLVAKGWPAAKIVLCFNYLPTSTISLDKALAWRLQLKAVQLAKGTSFLDFYTPISKHPHNASYSTDGVHPTADWNKVIDEIAQKNIELPAVPLPSQLLGFSGIRQGSSTILKWTVAQEQNVKTYIIERSLTGHSWDIVGQVASAGNTSAAREYSFASNSIAVKELYRLRRVDVNGSIELSKIVLINASKSAMLSIQGLFPNPSASTLNIMIATPVKEVVSIQIIDATGKVVQSQQSRVDAGSNTVDVSLHKIAAGTYLLKLTEADHHSVISRFVKQ